jgi:cysteine desulfurase
MKTKIVYLDNGATTMVDERILEKMNLFFKASYGNPSSMHNLGYQAKEALDDAREVIANYINADEKEIVFTSGGTESNNFALKGLAFANKKKHIVTTKVEHKCVLRTCEWLKKQGFKISYLDVDADGFISLEELKNTINEDTLVVSIIHANNEIGAIQNLEEIGKICREKKTYLHSDACQSLTKVPIDVEKMNIDLLTINSHKINGPKGAGALYIRKGIKIDPLLHGGEQEYRKRAGTQNIPAIVGFAEAAKLGPSKEEIKTMAKLRDKLIKGILKIKGVRLNGPKKNRLCNNVNVSFNAIEGEAIGGFLDQEGIASSTGSACSEALLEPSHVLRSIGLTHEEANGSLRLSLSRYTKEEEIDKVLEVLPRVVKKLRSISPFGGKENV